MIVTKASVTVEQLGMEVHFKWLFDMTVCMVSQRTMFLFSRVHCHHCPNKLSLGKPAGPRAEEVHHKAAVMAHLPLPALDHPHPNICHKWFGQRASV